MTGNFVLVTNKLMSNLLEDLKFISLKLYESEERDVKVF